MRTENLLIVSCFAVATACSEIGFEGNGTDANRTEVSLGLPTEASRTIVDDRGTTTWGEGDKIAVWAADADGKYALSGDVFSMWHYDATYASAYFTAIIGAMPEGRYTYYAASPAPLSVDGTKAMYNIPSEQNGSNIFDSDIMAAYPTEAAQLNAGRNMLDLRFRHLLHAIKITIPEDGNLMNRPITAFRMEFPTAVTGDITIDAANPEEPPVLADGGGNTLTITFPEPKQAGESFWALIYPARIEGEVKYTAYADKYESKEKTFVMNKECVAGRVTPMSLSIPKLNLATKIVFSLGDNFLGEDVESFYIADEAGNRLFSFTANAENSYEYTVEGEIEVPEYSGKRLKAVFDTQNAEAETAFDMPEIVPYIRTDVAPLTVPYLFEEDFSGLTAGGDGTFSESETVQSSNPSGVSLTKYGLAEGWSGARVGGATGLCLRINTKFETGIMAKKTYKGQIDTPPLARIKEGRTVTVKVLFDADTSESNTTCYIGNITESGAVNGETAIQNGSTISMSAVSGLTFSSQFARREAVVANCGPTSRIAFQPNTTRSGEFSVKFYDHFIYVDNIRISIVSQ
ncbi:MAG: fimbrillin family protein [Alistipes sp.]|nr:fimbrillin family protein [Alistipes sp.]